MSQVYNFSAGPSVIDHSVLERASKEMCNYKGTGLSVMELSHRGVLFQDIIQGLEVKVREALGVSEEYAVLFLQGGATLQFSMIPLNLHVHGKKCAYIDTGVWSKKAIHHASQIVSDWEVVTLASSRENSYRYIPSWKPSSLDGDLSYVHVTTNNTIYGTRYVSPIDTQDVPLVADMSSCIFSEPINVNRYGLIYAGAQKNIGPAGLTIVIIRRSLLDRSASREGLSDWLSYRCHEKASSCLNTPPCYSIYIASLVMDWLESQGGVVAMKELNEEKANYLYSYIDSSSFYISHVELEHRSIMNIPFHLVEDSLTSSFLKGAEEEGLLNLKGHRSTGGVRASIYNAMSLLGVKKLVQFMEKFEKNNSLGGSLNA